MLSLSPSGLINILKSSLSISVSSKFYWNFIACSYKNFLRFWIVFLYCIVSKFIYKQLVWLLLCIKKLLYYKQMLPGLHFLYHINYHHLFAMSEKKYHMKSVSCLYPVMLRKRKTFFGNRKKFTSENCFVMFIKLSAKRYNSVIIVIQTHKTSCFLDLLLFNVVMYHVHSLPFKMSA